MYFGLLIITAYAGLQQEEVLQVPHLPEPILVDNLSPQKRREKEEEGLATYTWYCHTFSTQSMPTHKYVVDEQKPTRQQQQ